MNNSVAVIINSANNINTLLFKGSVKVSAPKKNKKNL